ncbi:MAG TPA: hypothetical protein VMP08_22395 [Anaerolineae bacterium]|nr:hypothetical protein [Anaerolineae bacterium]
MKKVLLIGVTIVAVIALGNVLLASAQGRTFLWQQTGTCPASGYTCPFSGTNSFGGPGGMMGGRDMMGGGMMGGYGTYTGTVPGGMGAMHNAMMGANGMHEQVWTAIAKQLGMTYPELNTALQNGQTVAQLVQAKGVSLNDLKTAAVAAMKASFADLVKQGVMTQEQADWMLDRMDDMPMFNFGQGFGPSMMNGRVPGGMMNGRGMMRGYPQPTGPQG